MLTIFSCAFWPSVCLRWKVSVLIVCPFFDWDIFLILNCVNCLCISESNPLSATLFANIFPYSAGCLFSIVYGVLCCTKSFKLNQVPLVYLFGEGNGTPLQYSCLENPMDGGAWQAAVNEVAEGRTRLSNFTFTFHFHALEKEMAPHSSVLAWRIPGTGKPGGLPSIGSHRVGHD